MQIPSGFLLKLCDVQYFIHRHTKYRFSFLRVWGHTNFFSCGLSPTKL